VGEDDAAVLALDEEVNDYLGWLLTLFANASEDWLVARTPAQ